MEFDSSAAAVVMAHCCDLSADRGADSELFFQFALERRNRLLSFFNLAAGKLPLQRHRLILGALANENSVVAHDQCGDYLANHCCLMRRGLHRPNWS
jgi:hypothetical protein